MQIQTRNEEQRKDTRIGFSPSPKEEFHTTKLHTLMSRPANLSVQGKISKLYALRRRLHMAAETTSDNRSPVLPAKTCG